MNKDRQRWKALALMAIMAAGQGTFSGALAKNVMCLKTNTGQYIEVVRVSMMVVPDDASTFEIVVKDGQGATNVSNVSFEKHESDIDLSQYQGNPYSDSNPDMTKPVFLLTNTGKCWKMKELPVISNQDGTDEMNVTVGGVTETGVTSIYFYRGDESNVSGIDSPVAATSATEQLQLLTPISSQMQISGCGSATCAQVYSVDGKLQIEAAVADGVTTIQVGQLPAGVYVVRVGNKALKFTKN